MKSQFSIISCVLVAQGLWLSFSPHVKLVCNAQPPPMTVSEADVALLQAGRVFDLFFPNDVCENAPGVYGFCNQARFPTCREGRELICYNRRPMRNTFYKDIRQPHFYIDYNSVFCYPTSWSGCSSCSPGRYCLSEQRCILDERDYPCERWI